MVAAACTSGEDDPSSGSSSTFDEATAEKAVADAAVGYLAAVDGGDFARANQMRCSAEHLDVDGLAQFESASEELLAQLGGLEVSATDIAIGADGAGIAVATLAPSGADVVLRLEHDDSRGWRVCGQLTPEAEDTRSLLNEQPQEPLPAGDALEDVLSSYVVKGYESGRSDVPSSEPDDAERGVLRRESRLFTGPPGAPDVRVVATELDGVEAAVVEQLKQGSHVMDNSVAVLDVEGSHDRGVRYLASSKTFIQPSTVGPYWDAVWLLVDNYLVLVSVGPIDSATDRSIAEDVAAGIVEQLGTI